MHIQEEAGESLFAVLFFQWLRRFVRVVTGAGSGFLGAYFSVPCLGARQVANPREGSPQKEIRAKDVTCCCKH